MVRFWPVAAGWVAATLLYWPSLDAPFYADDYIYLRAASVMSWPDYLHAALVPYTSDHILLLTNNFWRPLYFLSFKALEPAFGGSVLPYHLLLLGIHFAGIALVFALAMRLSGHALAASVASLLFAVHPAGVESVTWVSALNSAALPCALGGWLAFAAAVESSEAGRRRWLLGLAAGLVAVAVGFRETAAVVVIAMAAWYLLVAGRTRLREARTWLPLTVLAAVVVGYEVLRTRFLTGPFTNPPQYELGMKIPGNAWKMVRYGLTPFSTQGQPLLLALSAAGGILLLATLVVALLTKRWLLASLLIGFLASVLPFAPLRVGLSARYSYFPSAFLALALGQAAVEGYELARPRSRARAVWVGAGAALAIWIALFVGFGNHQVRRWEAETGRPEQAWVDALRASFPTLPAGGTLYVANTPLVLALFGDYNLYPTVSYFYPQLAAAKRIDEAQVAAITRLLGPNDRLFIYRPK